MLLIRFALLTLGFTYLLTQSSIFMLLRMWITERMLFAGLLIYCPACSGFWIGGILGLLGAYPLPTLFGPVDAAVVACGLMATWTLAFVRVSTWELEQEYREDEDASTTKEG
jgi:hypothetical protein